MSAADRSKTDLGRKAKQLFRKACRQMGFVVYRVSSADDQDLPPLLDDPMEVIYTLRGGGKAAFRCPIRDCVAWNGLSFSDNGWNHFRATAEEYAMGQDAYQGSILEQYYSTWTPEKALDALPWDVSGPAYLKEMPAYTLHYPWHVVDPSDRKRSIEQSYNRELARAGGPALSIEHGFSHHGPTSNAIGEIEFARLINVYHSLQHHGYLRSNGDIGVTVLQRHQDFKYLLRYGYHRVGAGAALGMKHMPAEIPSGSLIRADDVDYWPQVRQGSWSRQEALNFFNHLFDFDSRAWAMSLGFLSD